MAKELLSLGTTEVASTRSVTIEGRARGALFILKGTAAAGDSIDIQVSPDNGANFLSLKEGGTVRQLDVNNSVLHVIGPGVFRVYRNGTTNNVGCAVSTEENP